MKHLLGFTLLTLLAACTDGSHAIDLHSDFRTTGNDIIVVNQDKFTYKALDVTLNSDYHYQSDSLAADQDLTIPLREFAKEDGTRFQPLTMRVQEIGLYAEDAEGNPGKLELTRK